MQFFAGTETGSGSAAGVCSWVEDFKVTTTADGGNTTREVRGQAHTSRTILKI